jgi:hypothetical protein
LLSAADEASLRDLAYHWDGAYSFTVVDHVWTATPLGDPADVLTAESAYELRQLVRHDYANRAAARQKDHRGPGE